MTTAALGSTPTVLTQGFRAFFLAAGLWAAVALAFWVAMFAAGAALPSRFDPLAWHIHEMLYGFAMAAIAGFLLTAVPSWTGRAPVGGAPLALLCGCWLAGRAACLISALLPPWLAVALDMAFPVFLIEIVAGEIVGARNWRNLPMVAPITVLAIADFWMHLEAIGVVAPTGFGWRLGLAAIIALISVVGGRIVPSFTRNWLTQRGAAVLPASGRRPLDQVALGLLHAGLFAWSFLPESRAVGVLLLLGAALNLWRMLRWRGIAAAAEPLLVILHIGYGWVVVGTGMLGLSMLDPALPLGAAIHALTVGAIGTMTLAVMTRATRGHTGRRLAADWVTVLIYGLVTLAAVARVAATFAAVWTMPLLLAAAASWIAAFGIFALAYSPMLLRRAER